MLQISIIVVGGYGNGDDVDKYHQVSSIKLYENGAWKVHLMSIRCYHRNGNATANIHLCQILKVEEHIPESYPISSISSHPTFDCPGYQGINRTHHIKFIRPGILIRYL